MFPIPSAYLGTRRLVLVAFSTFEPLGKSKTTLRPFGMNASPFGKVTSSS